MVNEVALTLLLGLFGWKVALLYLSLGLFYCDCCRLGHWAPENGGLSGRLGP